MKIDEIGKKASTSHKGEESNSSLAMTIDDAGTYLYEATLPVPQMPAGVSVYVLTSEPLEQIRAGF